MLIAKAKWPFLLALPLAPIVSAAFAALVGLPLLRLRGHYFAVASLGVGVAVGELVQNIDYQGQPVFGGASGLFLPIYSIGNGGIFSQWNVFINQDNAFPIEYNVQMILMALLGGTGTVFGPAAGAILLQLLIQFLGGTLPISFDLPFVSDTARPVVAQIILGLLLVGVVIFVPRGVIDFFGGPRRRGPACPPRAARETPPCTPPPPPPSPPPPTPP